MKSLLALFFCLGAALAAPQVHPAIKVVPKTDGFKPVSLLGDVIDIVTLLPFNDLHQILDEHLETDGALSAVIAYLQSDRFGQYVDDVFTYQYAQDYAAYLTDAGIPVEQVITILKEIIDGLVPGVEPDMEGSLAPLMAEVEAVTPITEITALVSEKLLLSESFQDWYVYSGSEKGHDLMNDIVQMDEQVYIQQQLEQLDVDIHLFWDGLYAFYGWGLPPFRDSKKFQPASLLGDALDIIALLPFHYLHEIFDEHLKSDGALSAVIAYLQSDRFKVYASEVLVLPIAQEYGVYLTDKGIPVTDIVGLLVAVIDGLEPGVEPDMTASLKPLIDEINAVTPVDTIISLVNVKLESSPDFQDWYVYSGSEKGHDLMSEIVQMDEQVYIQQQLDQLGVDIREFWIGLYDFYGWGAPPFRT